VAGTASTASAEVHLSSDTEQEPQQAAAAGVCPYFHEAVELLGKRWSGAIVHVLLPGPLRFSELAQAVPQISDRLLSMRLKELESFGIVARRVWDAAPVRVEYELTPKGKALGPTVTELRRWAREWLRDADG
jgi:DNA-binding HxlR family transcriptional regulator